MRVALANTALADVQAIGDYIGARNPERALNFVAELRFEHRGIRRRVHECYVIFCRVVGDVVRILRVVQRSRDLDRLLRG